MDGPTAQYLRPIAGLDAAMWVPPNQLVPDVDAAPEEMARWRPTWSRS